MISIETNAKSIELTGEEIHIHFTSGFPYFWLRNDGSGTVLMSLSPNTSEGKDGVISVLAGSSAGTMHGFNSTRQDMYISGSGKVMIMATYTPENPFRNARKGGGDGGGSTAKPVNYIHLYGTGVQGVGAIRVDYKHPLSKSGVENLCVLMTSLAENNSNKGYYQATGTSDAVNPYDTYAEIIPYNFGSRPTILNIMITEPDN